LLDTLRDAGLTGQGGARLSPRLFFEGNRQGRYRKSLTEGGRREKNLFLGEGTGVIDRSLWGGARSQKSISCTAIKAKFIQNIFDDLFPVSRFDNNFLLFPIKIYVMTFWSSGIFKG
jgi:hypothetical protein